MTTKKVFITRDLDKKSPFRIKMETSGLEVSAFSLVNFEAISFKSVPHCDWVFFYSANAVKFFFESGVHVPFFPQYACMGSGTAQALADYGGDASFVGRGTSEQVSKEFLEIASGQTVLFPQAKASLQSVQSHLKGFIRDITLVVYDNKMKKSFLAPDADILAFTSPLNFLAYSRLYNILNNQQIVAIGKTTAATISEEFSDDYHLADYPTMEALVEKLITLAKS